MPTTSHLIADCVQHARSGNLMAAKAAVSSAVAAVELCSDDLAVLAAVLIRIGDYDGAGALYSRSLELDGSHGPTLGGMARLLRFQGDLEKSETLFDRLVGIDNRDFEALFLRSSLRIQTIDRNHIADLLARFGAGVPTWRDAVYLAYALAKEYEDLGEFEAAFYHLKAGADIKRGHTAYNVADDLDMMDAIINAFAATDLAPASGEHPVGATPVFVLGMPRTGSTLVERVLACHPLVESAGELNDFTAALMALLSETGWPGDATRLDMPRATLGIDPARLRDVYLRSSAQKLTGKPYFIDKLPLNFLNVGLILRSMPHCRIVHVRRHPVATCFSMYKQLFDEGYPFSYDLGELAQYFLGYQRMMAHWHAIAPGRIIELAYEDLVTSPPSAIRRLVKAVGLPWDDACLSPSSNGSVSTTASASQIRRPVYTSSVSTWRSYRSHLGKLVQDLELAGLDLS